MAQLAAALAIQTSSKGGSSDTEVKEFAVKPRGFPSLSMVVTTVTPVMKVPKALRNSRGSIRVTGSARSFRRAWLTASGSTRFIIWRSPSRISASPRGVAFAMASAMAGVELGSSEPVAKSAGMASLPSSPLKASSLVAKIR